MDNLNKENFFNALMEQYPNAMQHFCKWIDEYKLRVGWNKLFNSDSDYQDANGKNAPAPKFHDLPIELQYGIVGAYITETIRENEAIFFPAYDFSFYENTTSTKQMFQEFLEGFEALFLKLKSLEELNNLEN